jgi:hypothetical protein
MPAFLVRTTDTNDLVGFYSAEDVDELIELVDDCTDVEACEYLELPSGGIYWDKPAVEVPIAVNENDEPEARIPWSRADMTHFWGDAVYGFDSGEWVEFFPDIPGPSEPEHPPKPVGPGRVAPLRRRH